MNDLRHLFMLLTFPVLGEIMFLGEIFGNKYVFYLGWKRWRDLFQRSFVLSIYLHKDQVFLGMFRMYISGSYTLVEECNLVYGVV